MIVFKIFTFFENPLSLINQYSEEPLKVKDKIHYTKHNNSKVVANSLIFQITEVSKLKKKINYSSERSS